MRALLVTSEEQAVRVLEQALEPFQTTLESYSDVVEALASARKRRFDVIIIDPGTIKKGLALLPVLREIATHRHQLVVSMLEPKARQPQSYSFGTDFVLWKPLNSGRVAQFLRAVNNMIVNGHMRYVRHSVKALGVVGFGIQELPAMVANVSAGGMCLQWLRPTLPHGPLRIRFTLPGQTLPLTLEGEVAWVGMEKQVGVRFVHVPESAQVQLERWIGEHLPASVDSGATHTSVHQRR
jgi:CheY-like chemotaxis protein